MASPFKDYEKQKEKELEEYRKKINAKVIMILDDLDASGFTMIDAVNVANTVVATLDSSAKKLPLKDLYNKTVA